MKRLFFVFAMFVAPLISSLDRVERQVAKLVNPSDGAIDFVTNLNVAHKVNDHDIFVFFDKNGLYGKKDVKKFFVCRGM